MFEILAAWRTVLHISEWTGLSLGALAGAVALFIFVPTARQIAILGGITVVIVYFSVLYGDAKGRADVKAQWDAAEVQAEKARQERDATVAKEIEAKFATAFADDGKAKQDEIDALKAVAASGDSCPLGDAALQLRGVTKADSLPNPSGKPAGDLRKTPPAGAVPAGGRKR